jgi:uncharacterized protein
VATPIKSFSLEGPAGKLEALLNEGLPSATHAALVCHPHPLYGGTMHNKVVYHAMKALNSFGFPVLRFNFRGAGLSEGEHDQGRGEVEDVRTALNWLHSQFAMPMIFCGFSFGAATGLRAACPDPRIVGMIALGTPVSAEGRFYSYDFLETCTHPKLFVSGSRDQFAPEQNLRRLFTQVAEPKEMTLIDAADHFFEGRLNELQATIHDWVKRLLQTPAEVL